MSTSPKSTHGYTKELLILPFDHRNSFQEKMFGIHGKPTPEQTALIASFKSLIYDGFEKALKQGLPREKMGILVDEQFGQDVLRRAKADGVSTAICAEKSGQDEFDFEYGSSYGEHIEKADPTFVKVLVRYNPEGDEETNRVQANKLKELSQFLSNHHRLFMFELLVPATSEQLERCKGDKKVYDVEMRPRLMVRAIQELQAAGVECDVWKLEGLDRSGDYKMVCDAARAQGRDRVAVIVLGRGENEAKVREWLAVGANVPGVIGFAVGRTVFWEPLKAYRENKITKEQASDQIAKNYAGLCHFWLESRKGN